MSISIPTFDFFLTQFEAQFEEEAAGSMKSETKFRDLEEWSSMQALVVNLFFDDNYGVTLDTEDYRNSATVGDLYRIIKQKLE